MKPVELWTLPAGSRFATASGKAGTLLQPCTRDGSGARVRWDTAGRHVVLEGAEFDAPGKPEIIATRTEVTTP